MRHGRVPRGSALLLLALTTLVIAVLTLRPVDGRAGTLECFFCAETAGADAVLNVILFVPFGAAFALLRLPLAIAAFLGIGFSAGIELAQNAIPGRDASLADVITNTSGTIVGLYLVHLGPRLYARALRNPTIALGAWVTTIAVQGLVFALLQQPAPGTRPWYGQWTADLGHLEHYQGSVLDAAMGATPLPSGLLPDRAAAAAAFLGKDPLRIRFIAGPQPPDLAPIVSVFDESQREILVLGADREDLVLRWRRRAHVLHLTAPELRFREALAGVAPGDTVALALVWQGGRARAMVSGRSYVLTRPGPESGWALLLQRHVRPGWETALSVGWVVLLFSAVVPFATVSAKSAIYAWIAALASPWITGVPARPQSWVLGAALVLAAGGLLVASRGRDRAAARTPTQRSTRS